MLDSGQQSRSGGEIEIVSVGKLMKIMALLHQSKSENHQSKSVMLILMYQSRKWSNLQRRRWFSISVPQWFWCICHGACRELWTFKFYYRLLGQTAEPCQ